MGKLLLLLLLFSTSLKAQTAADLFDTSMRKNGDKGLSQSNYSRSDSAWVAGAKSLTYTSSYTLPTASPTMKGGILIGNRLYASPIGELNAVPNLSAYTNDVNYWTATQVRQAIADSNAARVIYFSGDFLGSGTPTDPFRLVTAPGTALTVDPLATQNSPNAASSGDLWSAKLGFAAKNHAHIANDVTDLNTAFTSYLKGLPGFGTDKVLSYNGTSMVWVPATITPVSTTALPASTLGSSAQLYTQITINWTAVPNATNYTLSTAQDAGFTVGVTSIYTGSSLTYAHTGLVGNYAYYYRLTPNGTNSYTNGPPAYLTVSTQASPATLTASALTLSGVSTTSLTAAWTAVTNATGYELSRAFDADFTNNATTVYSGTALSGNQTGLLSSTPYYYRLKALGTGNYADGPYATAAATTATPVSQTQLAASTLSFSGVSSTAVTLTWTTIANASGYLLQRATDNAFSANVATVYSGTALTTTRTGLSPSTVYYYRAKATGTGYYTDGNYSPVVSVTTSTPVGASTLSLNGAAGTQITTVWTSVTNAAGYTLQQAMNSAFTTGVTTVYVGTATTFTQTGLTPQTVYYYRVNATGNGTLTDGAASPVLSATTTPQTAGPYAVERTFRVNLSSSYNTAGVTGWNVWTVPNLTKPSSASGTALANLLTDAGITSTVSLSVLGEFSGTNNNIFTPDLTTGIWPALVMDRGWNYVGPATAGMRISGLNPAKYYQVYALGAHPANSSALSTTFSVGNLSRLVYMPGNYGDAALEFGSAALATFYNIQPDANGSIDLLLQRPCCMGTALQGFVVQETNSTK